MAFTREWSDTRPAGTTQAYNIDNEMGYARKDIRERVDVEHVFPSADVATTGCHEEGSARTFVAELADISTNISSITSGAREGRLQYSTDKKSLSIVTGDSTYVTYPLDGLDMFELSLMDEITPYTMTIPLDLAWHIVHESAVCVIDFSKILAVATTNSHLQMRLVVYKGGPTGDCLARVIAGTSLPLSSSGTSLLGDLEFDTSGPAYDGFISDWVDITTVTTDRWLGLFLFNVSAGSQTCDFCKIKLQFRRKDL
jgi:hypothetical protein